MERMINVLLIAIIVIGLLVGSSLVTTGAYFSDTEESIDNALRCWVSVVTDYYLHNNPTPPTGDTNSQLVLPVDTTAPTATTLYNYDMDRDPDPGLLIDRGGSGVNETDPELYQAWRTANLTSALTIVGNVTIDLWSTCEGFASGKSGEAVIFLRDYNGSSYTEIGSGSLYEDPWSPSATWEKKTITISGLNYTIPSGNQLEVKLIVGDSSGADLWFAYDTTSYSSVAQIP